MLRSWLAGFGLTALVLTGCASPSYGPSDYPYSYERPSTQVYFYSDTRTSESMRSRDRYECYLWAQRQTGFDPSAPNLAPHQRIGVARQPPTESNALKGAVVGLFLGAFAAGPEHSGAGATIGAATGAAIGAARDIEIAEAQEEALRRHAEQRYVQIERRAEAYRRALAACLEGRGYIVE